MNKLPPFKFFALQNFPFIEEDFDTLKNYELMCKIVEYIKKNIVPTVDEHTEQIDNLLNWFDNLDVQEEIDNKLDEMAESGELAEIINEQLFSGLNDRLSLLENERILCIGDSYGVGTTAGGTIEGWCDRLKTIRNLSSNNFIKLVEGSSGFTATGLQGHTFQTLLESNISNITNKDTITKVIVCGGHNDTDTTGQVLNSTINYFISYCKTQFPNAKVYVGMIGNNSNKTTAGQDIRNALYDYVIRSYQNSVRYGGIYLSGIENIMHDYKEFMSEDGIHPNSTGYNFIASYISNCLDGSYADFTGNVISDTFTAENSSSTFNIKSRIVNDVQTFFFNTITIRYDTAFDWVGGNRLVLSNDTPANYRYHNREIAIPVVYYTVSTGNVFHGGVGFLEFRGNGITIRNIAIGESGYEQIDDVTDVVIQPATHTIELGVC